MEKVEYEVTIDGETGHADLVHVLYKRDKCNPEILMQTIRKQDFPVKIGRK